MKKITFALILLGLALSAGAQRKRIDTLRAKLNTNLDDTTRINVLLDLSRNYYISNPDSNIFLSLQIYELAGKHNLLEKQARALNGMATGYASLGDYAKVNQMFFKSLRIQEKLNQILEEVVYYNNLGDTYIRQGDYKKTQNYLIAGSKR